MSIYHKHHIIPKHMGGTDDPSNIIIVTIEEHANAHKELWEKYGKKEDFIAWKCLSGKSEECEKERIELSKEGFITFLKDEVKKSEWVNNIKKSRKHQVITEEHAKNIGISLKKSYKEGRKRYVKPTLEVLKSNYEKNKHLIEEGRKKSSKWKQSVTNENTRIKKRLSDPRSTKITIDDVTYDSIRHAAKESKYSYSQIRKMLKDGLL